MKNFGTIIKQQKKAKPTRTVKRTDIASPVTESDQIENVEYRKYVLENGFR